MGERLAGGEVGQPAAGRQAAAGTGAQGGVSVARLQRQVQVVPGPGPVRARAFTLRPPGWHCIVTASRLLVIVRGYGGNLYAWAVECLGVPQGTVLETVDFITRLLPVDATGVLESRWRRMLTGRLVGQNLGVVRCAVIRFSTCLK